MEYNSEGRNIIKGNRLQVLLNCREGFMSGRRVLRKVQG